jgi:glycosyltransferase involved in cell wall biosynthesis
MTKPKSILFLGETYRADAQTWIKGIESVSGIQIDTLEVKGTTTRFKRILAFFGFAWQLVVLNFTKSYDLVLAERATSYGFFSLLVKAKKRVVAQQGITDAWPEEGFSGFYKRILQRIVYSKVDLIHAWGEVMVPAMIESNADPKKIMILPKGIDLTNYVMVEKKNPTLAIVTRSFTEVYHHEDILDAMALLARHGWTLHLIMVGDGILGDQLKRKTKELNLMDQVTFTGRIPNHELPAWLSKASIYLSVPETEGVSASLFEAMATGCFPIVTDLPGTRAFIRNGENGFLVPVSSPIEIATALTTYLENTEVFKEAVKANRLFIEQHVNLQKNMNSIWTRYVEIFQN